MMIIAQYFLDFLFFSFLGWVYECTYCMIQSGHWENRGFLYGPVCPIYGVGTTTALILFRFLPSMEGPATPWWKIFLICMVGSAVLEYGTSWALERMFHAVWWDYRNMPLNVNGRICLPASLGFGAAGIVVVKVIMPVAGRLHHNAHPILDEALAMILVAYLSADLVLTAASLTSLIARMEAIEAEFNERAESACQFVRESPQVIADKAREYEQTAMNKAVLLAGTLNERQRYVLSSVKRFTSEKVSAVSGRVKAGLKILHSKTIGRNGSDPDR